MVLAVSTPLHLRTAKRVYTIEDGKVFIYCMNFLVSWEQIVRLSFRGATHPLFFRIFKLWSSPENSWRVKSLKLFLHFVLKSNQENFLRVKSLKGI